MDVTLEDARAHYWAAYEAYRACAARNAQHLAAGTSPPAEDVKAEEHAASALNKARRQLMDAMAVTKGPKR